MRAPYLQTILIYKQVQVRRTTTYDVQPHNWTNMGMVGMSTRGLLTQIKAVIVDERTERTADK